MYEIIFYKDSKGREPVIEYIDELRKSSSKDSRIRLSKIQDYIKVLRDNGTNAGMPYIKHLDGEIWELRPVRDRVLFAGLVDDTYILLHTFVKKTQKTPAREIEKAKRELDDFKQRSGL